MMARPTISICKSKNRSKTVDERTAGAKSFKFDGLAYQGRTSPLVCQNKPV